MRPSWRNCASSGWPPPTEAEQKRIVREMQLQSFRDVPYVPTGLWLGYTCFNKSLTGIQNGWPVFWGVRRA